jgi:hypothetical protein
MQTMGFRLALAQSVAYCNLTIGLADALLAEVLLEEHLSQSFVLVPVRLIDLHQAIPVLARPSRESIAGTAGV